MLVLLLTGLAAIDWATMGNGTRLGKKGKVPFLKMELSSPTFLRGISATIPTKLTAKRKPVIQPMPGSL